MLKIVLHPCIKDCEPILYSLHGTYDLKVNCTINFTIYINMYTCTYADSNVTKTVTVLTHYFSGSVRYIRTRS